MPVILFAQPCLGNMSFLFITFPWFSNSFLSPSGTPQRSQLVASAQGLTIYFSTLPDSMYTAFRCFTGECVPWPRFGTRLVGGLRKLFAGIWREIVRSDWVFFHVNMSQHQGYLAFLWFSTHAKNFLERKLQAEVNDMGQPLHYLLKEEFGLPFIFCYVCSYMLVTMGICNVILAVYVDITMKAQLRRISVWHHELKKIPCISFATCKSLSTRSAVRRCKK